MSVLSFLRAQAGFLAFGSVCMIFGSLGQTYLIALYVDELCARFDLTLTDFGTLYSSVTLLSAVCLIWLGRLIDYYRLPVFSAGVFIGLACACALMGFATQLAMCALALFLLRLFGQGLAIHTGVTSISRAYHHHRGTAVAVSQLGYPLGESLFPACVIFLLMVMDWQNSWLVFAAVVSCVALPAIIFLARFEPNAPSQTLSQTPSQTPIAPTPTVIDETTGPAADRGVVLRDPRFYGVLPLYLSPPFILTGMFLSQLALANEKSWSTTDLALAFTVYAGVKIIVSLITGRLVDRYTARRIMPFSAIPLIAAFLVIVAPVSELGSVYLYMGLIGVNLGMTSPISGGLWPELYGTKYLGAIRSMTSPMAIFATALAPISFGYILDAGVSFQQIAAAAIVYLVAAACLAGFALHNSRTV